MPPITRTREWPWGTHAAGRQLWSRYVYLLDAGRFTDARAIREEVRPTP